MSVATGYGSGIFPNGTDFPFVAPSTDIRGMFEDINLVYTESHSLPLKVTRVSGFQFLSPSGSNLIIEDEDDNVVFDTSVATTRSNSLWGSDRIVYSWEFSGKALYAVQYIGNGAVQRPALFYPDNAILDERAYLIEPDKVNKLRVGATDYYGDVSLVAGNNFVFVLRNTTSVEGKRKINYIQTAVGIGYGTGIYAQCPDDCVSDAIKTVNGIKPTSYGNLGLVATDCYWLGVPGISDGSHYWPTYSNRLDIFNNCSPCCECNDFVKTYKGIRNLYEKFKTLGSRTMKVRSQQYANQAKWECSARCRESNSMRILALPAGGNLVSVVLTYCNVSQTIIGPIRIELNLTSTGNVGFIKDDATTWYPAEGTSPILILAEGEWPDYVFRWDELRPGRSAKVKFIVDIPSAEPGDFLLINAQTILDEDEVLVEATPYSVGILP
jgi:hypothetical protein